MNKSSWALVGLWTVVLCIVEVLVKNTPHSTLVAITLVSGMLLNQAIHVFSYDRHRTGQSKK
jgi:hypothetical protein